MDNDTQKIELFDENDIVVFEPSKMLNVPSSTIHIENKMSLVQKKLWFELVYYAFPKMGTQRKYTITLARLRELLGWNETTSNDTELKEALRGLNETTVNWNIFGKDTKNTSWQSFPLLAGCEIPKNSGNCIFSLSPFLEDRFAAMGEEAYVKIDLIISRKFQSKYSLSIYCLALDYLMLEIGYSEKKFSIAELRRYLALKEGEYKLTADMNRWIIKPSEEEINKTSDMNIEIKPFKDGKKIAGYKLCMSLKEGRAKEYLDRKNKMRQSVSLDTLISDDENKIFIKKEITKKELIQINNEQLKKFFAKYQISFTTDTFQEKLEEAKQLFGADNFQNYLVYLSKYAENEYKKGTIKSFAGFFVSLFKDDTQINNYFHDIEQENKKLEAKRIKVENLLDGEVKAKYENAMYGDFEEFLVNNIITLEKKFIEIVNTHITKGFARDYLIDMQNKGVVDKTLILNHKKHVRLVLINELKKFQEELGYKKITFDEWKINTITNDYLNQIRSEIEKSLK